MSRAVTRTTPAGVRSLVAVVSPAGFALYRDGASRAITASLTGQRGFVPTYHPGTANRCLHCGATAWHVGRVTAECAGCASPLALSPLNAVRLDLAATSLTISLHTERT